MDARERLGVEFFRCSPVECARELIGGVFEWDGAAGVIVETEAYGAEGDAACHTAFRPAAREFVKLHAAGDAYVYLNYGVHWLFNVLVKGGQGDGFVLFRALEPVRGMAGMKRRRGAVDPQELCSGPGKLTQALGIDGSIHGKKFLRRPKSGIYRKSVDVTVLAGARIGISREKELPWRFMAAGSACLSRPPA